MPGEYAVRCAECGLVTLAREAKYANGSLQLNHKPDCSQQGQMYPRLYTHQA